MNRKDKRTDFVQENEFNMALGWFAAASVSIASLVGLT